MEKNERFDYYNHSTGLSEWTFSSKEHPDRIIRVNDGPSGLRRERSSSLPIYDYDDNNIKNVCLPTPSAVAASFDKKVAYEVGNCLAKQCLSVNTHIILAPSMNLKVSPLCGRNFEYFSEDPYLTGILAASEVKGIQEYGVGATIKHYALNSREFSRRIVSSEVSKRALNETYLSAFNYVIKHASPSSIMTSYNKVNGEYVPESFYMMNRLLNTMSFKGLVMSDWVAISNRAVSMHYGLDLEMPKSKVDNEYIDLGYNKIFNDEDLIRNDKRLDEISEKYGNNKIHELNNGKLHYKAVSLASKSIVLAKNEKNTLPFDVKDKVLVLGEFASNPVFVGTGSGSVSAYRKKSFIDILTEKDIKFKYLQGYDKKDILVKYEEIKKSHCKKIVLFIGQYEEGEDKDREDIELTQSQLKLIALLKEHKVKFTTVVITGSVLNIEEVYNASKALVISYLAGEGQAEAIFNNLYGIYNPSGRLPETWISSLDQNPFNKEMTDKNIYYMYYDNDIYVGYKYYELNKSDKFMLPFGYGLSYSTFSYDNAQFNLENDKVTATIEVTNTSKIDGEAVLQLYVRKVHSNIYRPLKEMKDFDKVMVKAKDKATMHFEVELDELKAYRTETDKMELEDGLYEFLIADGLENVYANASIMLNGVKFYIIKKPAKLDRKEISNNYTINSPIGSLFNNQYFKEYVKNMNLPIDADNFEKLYVQYRNEPLRLMLLEPSMNLSIYQLNDLVANLNNSERELSKHVNYEYLINK